MLLTRLSFKTQLSRSFDKFRINKYLRQKKISKENVKYRKQQIEKACTLKGEIREY